MKLCKDCKHATNDGAYAMCKRKAEPVTGWTETYCSVERMFIWPIAFITLECGTTGRYWEAK